MLQTLSKGWCLWMGTPAFVMCCLISGLADDLVAGSETNKGAVDPCVEE